MITFSLNKKRILINKKNWLNNFSIYKLHKLHIYRKLYFVNLLKKLKKNGCITNNVIFNYKIFFFKKINLFIFKKINFFKNKQINFFKKKDFIIKYNIIISIWCNLILKKGKKFKVFKKIVFFLNFLYKKIKINSLKLFLLLFKLLKPIFNIKNIKNIKSINFKHLFVNVKKQIRIFLLEIITYFSIKKEKYLLLSNFLSLLKKKLYIYSFLIKKKKNYSSLSNK